MHDPCKTPGAFSWCELTTTDLEAAKQFYRSLFGWHLEEMDVGMGPYTVIKTSDGEGVGGMMTMPPDAQGQPPMWGAYITVDDCDATLEQAKSLGAKVLVEPMDIPEVGRFAWFQDPQGAAIAVIAYAEQV